MVTWPYPLAHSGHFLCRHKPLVWTSHHTGHVTAHTQVVPLGSGNNLPPSIIIRWMSQARETQEFSHTIGNSYIGWHKENNPCTSNIRTGSKRAKLSSIVQLMFFLLNDSVAAAKILTVSTWAAFASSYLCPPTHNPSMSRQNHTLETQRREETVPQDITIEPTTPFNPLPTL